MLVLVLFTDKHLPDIIDPLGIESEGWLQDSLDSLDDALYEGNLAYINVCAETVIGHLKVVAEDRRLIDSGKLVATTIGYRV